MQPRIQEGRAGYHFTIRMHNHRPLVLSHPKQPTFPLTCNYPHTLTTLKSTPSAPNLHASPSPITPRPLCTPPALPLLSPRQKEKVVGRRCHTEEAAGESQIIEMETIQLQLSLIAQLQTLEELISPARKALGDTETLQQMLVQEAQSIRVDEATLSQDEYSQIVTITEEEREFFNKFPGEKHLSDSLFRNLKVPDKAASQLQQRKRLIRNFFRPKGSFMKDDRTCCNSFNNMDSLIDSKQGSPVSNRYLERQKREE